MANSREVLLKLVRLAMGWESDFSLPEDVDWKEVLNIASEQGVEAIAIEGYQAIKEMTPNANLSLDSFENKPLLLEYIGRLSLVEQGNRQRLSALLELSSILNDCQIPFLLMKGFACGQYYPNPMHRSCGDIDIYPGNKFYDSNIALKAAGIDVEPYYYRHSASMINGVMVENHKILCDLRGPRRQTGEFEAHLKSEAWKSIVDGKEVEIDGHKIAGARFPLANFNALFLPWHVSAHFAFERVTLRHLLDWALFLVQDGKGVDVKMFREAKSKYTYGYSKLAEVLTNLSMRYLKMPTGDIPLGIIEDASIFDNHLADKVFDYMFVGQPRKRDENVWKFRWNNIKNIWRDRWKYKEIYNMSVAGFLCQKAIGVIFKVGE